jgi:hypothetical protein
MNSGFSDFADFNEVPPYYNNQYDSYYDKGEGIPQMDVNNSTIHDILRTPFLLTHEHRKNYRNQSTTAL